MGKNFVVVLHFNMKVLDLHIISSVLLRKKNADSHKCIVAKVAREDRCTEIK
jgi:hypothetical protein